MITKQEIDRSIRQTVKRAGGTLFITDMKQLSHGEYYEDGARRYLYDSGTGFWRMIVFRRTGNQPDSGEWLDFDLSIGTVTW